MKTNWTRRQFLGAIGGGAVCCYPASRLFHKYKTQKIKAEVFIAKVPDYNYNIAGSIREGIIELGILPQEIKESEFYSSPIWLKHTRVLSI